MAGIYIHIPFCKQKCHYCDFYSSTDTDRAVETVESIMRELESEKGFIGDVTIDSIYFGGGTPSLLHPSMIQRVIDRVESLWSCDDEAEITVEANPEDMTADYLGALAATDTNRLSIGIQSFVDRHLSFMNRRHDSHRALAAVRNAKEAGFKNLTIDLMYGIPGISMEELRNNLEQTLSLDVGHISAYHLSIEENTVFGRSMKAGKLRKTDEGDSEAQYMLVHEMLANAGYEHYEISNFALPGFRARHNSSYWKGEPYLGAGPSAHSFNGTVRRYCAMSVDGYVDSGGENCVYESEILTPADVYNEFVMTSLRCSEGVDAATLGGKFGKERLESFAKTARKFISGGMLVASDGKYRIPAEKYLISDSIISEFFE